MTQTPRPRSPRKLSRTKQVIFALIMLGLLLVILEVGTRLVFDRIAPLGEYQLMAMRGDEDSRRQLSYGQPYLNYIQTPGHEDEHGPQVNEHGYRGPQLPLERTSGTLRVVCLGGSTTYGFGVDRPEQAYPGQLEKLLNEHPPRGSTGPRCSTAD